MKLKPRAASSSCGEETPRSNRMPSNLRPGSNLIGAARERGERREKNRDARISREAGSGGGDGLGIAIEAKQTAVRDELLQNRPCMSASAKSGVQVGATRLNVQRRQYLW